MDQRAMRVVSVRYRATVYADVDLDSGRVVCVSGDLESIRPDWAVDQENPMEIVEPAFDSNAHEIPVEITQDVAGDAFRIAEGNAWPKWDLA